MSGEIFAISCRRFLSATIFDQPRAVVETAVGRCLEHIAPGRFSSRTAPINLKYIYEVEPEAGGAHLKHLLLFSPESNPDNTVLVCDLADGWASLSFLLARELKGFQIRVLSTQDGVKYPQNLFEVWRLGESIRFVMAMRDSDKWQFFERGAVQPFEDVALYKESLKKNRLSRSILKRYLERIGWDIAQKIFWQSKELAVYFTENETGPL